ncbi:hypothetical protein FRC19_001830 [Serendipita sp. 401]|nr:hypothetical protein FRC19_001830 [Serendipita sp. 401]
MAETEPANNTNHIHTTTVSGPTTTTATTVPAGGLTAPDGTAATDGVSTVNNLTRVNTSDNNSQKKEKDDQQVNVSEKNTEESAVKGEKAIVVDESMLLTGKKLALAHIGFLLSVLPFTDHGDHLVWSLSPNILYGTHSQIARSIIVRVLAMFFFCPSVVDSPPTLIAEAVMMSFLFKPGNSPIISERRFIVNAAG